MMLNVHGATPAMPRNMRRVLSKKLEMPSSLREMPVIMQKKLGTTLSLTIAIIAHDAALTFSEENITQRIPATS